MATSYNIPSSSTDGEEKGPSDKKEQELLYNKYLKRINSEHAKLGVQMPTGPNPSALPALCYNIGDIGPAGGVIVSIPGVGNNHSDFYIECSLENLYEQASIGSVPNWNGTAWTNTVWGKGSFGTGPWNSQSYTHNHEVGAGWYNQIEMIANGGVTSNIPPESNAFLLCEQYIQNGFDDWYLPNVHEWEEIIDNGWNDPSSPLFWQNSTSPNTAYGMIKYWTSTGSDTANSASSYSLSNAFWNSVTNGSPTTDNGINAVAVNPNLSSPFYHMARFWDVSVRAIRRFKCNPQPVIPCHEIGDITPQGGMIFATPYAGWNNTKYYYEVGLTDLHTGGTPLNSSSWLSCDVTGSSLVGAEWGLHGNTAISTSIEFGDGYKNTILIDGFPTGPNNPYINTREIAASVCLNYGVTQQHDLEEGEEWFLPSLYEMWYMYTTVGPGTAFGTTLNLSESQIGSLASGAMTNDGWYWTSSQYSALDADNPGNYNPGFNPSGFPGEENYAWSFINTSNLSPSQPPLSLQRRCHASSVRPVRRFICKDIIDEERDVGVDYNFRYLKYNFGGVQQLGSIGGSENPGTIMTDMIFNTSGQNKIGGNPGEKTYFYFHSLTAANKLLYKMDTFPSYHLNYNACFNGQWYENKEYHITVWDRYENLLGKWRYRRGSGSTWCGNRCRIWTAFTLQGQLEGDDKYVEIPDHAYVKIEGRDENPPAPGVFHNTKDLTNYAGTGTNLRCIDSSGNIINNNVDYWEVCIWECKKFGYGGWGNNGCRWWAVGDAPKPLGYSSHGHFANQLLMPPGGCDIARCTNTNATPAAPGTISKRLGILGSENECSGTTLYDGEFNSNTALNKYRKRIKNKYR